MGEKIYAVVPGNPSHVKLKLTGSVRGVIGVRGNIETIVSADEISEVMSLFPTGRQISQAEAAHYVTLEHQWARAEDEYHDRL